MNESTELQAAARLSAAARSGVPTAPVRALLADLAAAYRVQEQGIAERESGANRRVGRKVGLTSEAVQRQLGVDQPDFGVLLADMDATRARRVAVESLLQPRIEAEIAFVLASDVDRTDRASVLAAVDFVTPALEIVDSRVQDWDITILDTVADNASSGMFVLGDARVPVDSIDLVAVRMELEIDGVVVSSGSGADCLGDPVNALVWVAETAQALGRPLRAGETVLAGALGPMVPLPAGVRVCARIDGIGMVETTTEGK